MGLYIGDMAYGDYKAAFGNIDYGRSIWITAEDIRNSHVFNPFTYTYEPRSPIMSQETVFEVCIIERPTVKDAEEGKSAKIVLAPTAVIAKSTQDAPLVAALNAKIEIDPSRMEVLVRPFLDR